MPAVPPLAVGFDEHITSLQGAIRGPWPRPRPTTCCIVASTLHSGGKRPHTNMLHAPGGGPPRLDQELLQFSSHSAVTGNDCATSRWQLHRCTDGMLHRCFNLALRRQTAAHEQAGTKWSESRHVHARCVPARAGPASSRRLRPSRRWLVPRPVSGVLLACASFSQVASSVARPAGSSQSFSLVRLALGRFVCSEV